MDDTQQSRTNDAAATRKRRSSILKSQRPARTPFSELEFNVATPTDTAKSRRVSFSRRTGVAEYVTNEATNTWKNIYEEHNKSLESSGNDSEVNPARQTVEHLGRRLFDQQFEEVEAVDFIDTLAPPPHTSFNNINFSEQIASLDSTSDAKLTAPNSKFELSALTDQQSKLFCNDFTVTGIGESSGKIDFNFSNIQRIGEKDDLDEIQRDLERISNNVICPGPADHHNISEYIEVDLNMTHVAKTDDCDMSITDTISTPKVQDVSKIDKDWITDKENIAVNPYVTPPETDNFVVNDEPDQVLVFDGKRLTLQTEKSSNDFRQTLLPNTSTEIPVRKTIVLNTDDDLPNFVDDAILRSDVDRTRNSYHDPSICVQAVHKVEIVKRPTTNNNAGNMPGAQSLATNIMSGANENIKTIIYNENETADISMTQSVNGLIFTVDNKQTERRRTVVYDNDNANISMTQALPTNIIHNEKPERRKTIIYEDDKADVSITQALPSRVILDQKPQEKRKTIIYEDDIADISITQALPSQVILNEKPQEKRKTIIYEDDKADVSITQALPSRVILDQKPQEKRKTIIYEDDKADVSITQALASRVILDQKPQEKRKTIIYDDEVADISITQALPSRVILDQKPEKNRKTVVHEDDIADVSMTQALPSRVILDQKPQEKRKTIIYEDDKADVSITQALPSRVILDQKPQEKRKTIIYEDDKADVSITQALPSRVIVDQKPQEKRKTIIYEDDKADVSITQALASRVILDQKPQEKRKTIIYDDDVADISITQALPSQVILNQKPQEKRKTIIYEDGKADVSITQALPSRVILDQKPHEKRKTIIYNDDVADISITQALSSRVILDQKNHEKRKTIVFDDNNGDISITQALPAKIVLEPRQEKRKTILFEDDTANISVTQAAPTNLILTENPSASERRRTVLYQDDAGNISVTQTVPQNIILGKSDLKEDTQIFDANNISMTQVLPTNILIKDSNTNKSISDDPNPIDSEPSVLESLLDMSDPVESAVCNKYADTEVKPLAVEEKPQHVKETSILTFVIAADEEMQTNKDEIVKNAKSTENSKFIEHAVPERRKTIIYEDEESYKNIKLTENSQFIGDHADSGRRKTIIYEDDKTDISITQALPSRVVLDQKAQEKRKTVVFDDDNGNISITQVLPVNIVLDSRQEKRKTILNEDETENNMSVTQAATKNLILTENTSATELIYQDDTDDISVAQTDPQNIKPCTSDLKEGTKSFDAKISMTQAFPTNIVIKDSYQIFQDPNPKDSKTSVLHTLLDMSDPVESVTYNKDSETDVERLIVQDEPDREEDASTVSFVIAEDEGIQTDKIESDLDGELSEIESDTIHFVTDSRMSTEYKQPEEILQNALAQLMSKRDQLAEMDNISADPSSTDDKETQFTNNENEIGNVSRDISYVSEKEDEKVHRKSFKDANDTKELLDMICDITDNSRCSSKEEPTPEEMPPEEIPPEKEAVQVTKPFDSKEPFAIESKIKTQEPRRLSFATKRQSIIISREDLLNNISMAQAVLQKSRVEFDESNLTEDTQDSSPEELGQTQHKSNRMSSEVVKTLHFDDESLSESSMKSDLSKTWPIKKTVFGETSYAKAKTNVIPSYLKDVSDGIKQLMSDLVKPMSDAVPFETQEEKMRRSMSTVSTQIQANLITSSQIDVNNDLSSATASREDNPCYISGRGILKVPGSSEMSSEQEVVSECSDIPEPPCRQQSFPTPVLVFDHENPLNNILLGPLDYKPHDYKPLSPPVLIENLANESEVTLCGSERSTSCQINMEMDASSMDIDTMTLESKDVDVNTEHAITQYRVAVHAGQKALPVNKPWSLDRAVNVHAKVEDSQVNTVIAMKSNKELLETSASLTLIDSLSEPESKTNSCQQYTPRKERRTPTKPDKLKPLATLESDITSTDDSTDRLVSKGKKRSHIPVTPNRRQSVEVTPKPNSKMLKMSNSPNKNRVLLRMSHEPNKLPAERDTDSYDDTNHIEDNANSEKQPPSRSFDSTITIQQLITEYQIDVGLNKEILDVLKDTDYCKSCSLTTEAPSRSDSLNSDSIDKVCSFTSSKNFGCKTVASRNSSPKSQSTVHSAEHSRTEWHPELTSLSSTKNINYIDSGVNIVSKIDMLPFMGSYECERETSLADTWSFRLLHGRIRLTIRLAHRHDNATRTRVRADTPVTDVSVDTIEYDKKNPVAILCIRFACETMRYMVSSGKESKYLARDVPLLLRRCAAVARVALRWGRAMHDAKLHLAYTLDTEGHLTVKVANIPLRSVWEVSMLLELVVDASQAPWPRASHVKVKRVVSDVPVSDEDINKALKNTPNDWGHAPKTLWRIFRYLKHKQRDDNDLLLGV